MSLFTKLKNKVAVATMQADKEIFFNNISRTIAPSSIIEYPTYIILNDETLARCIVAGIPPLSDISGYSADMSNTVIDELMALSDDGYRVTYSFSVIPISNLKSMQLLDAAMYHNKVSQQSFRDKTGQDPNKQPPLKKILEQEDFAGNYKEIFQGKQKMFSTSFIIIFYGNNEGQLRAAESLIASYNVPTEKTDYGVGATATIANTLGQIADVITGGAPGYKKTGKINTESGREWFVDNSSQLVGKRIFGDDFVPVATYTDGSTIAVDEKGNSRPLSKNDIDAYARAYFKNTYQDKEYE